MAEEIERIFVIPLRKTGYKTSKTIFKNIKSRITSS